MTIGERNQLVEEHADVILASKLGIHTYVIHFEAQMQHGKISRLSYAIYLHLARAGMILAGLDHQGIW